MKKRDQLNLEGLTKKKKAVRDDSQFYAIMPAAAASDKELSDNAYRILGYLKGHKLAVFCPGYPRMIEDMGKTRSTIRRGIKELEALGYLTRINPMNDYLEIELSSKSILQTETVKFNNNDTDNQGEV